MPSNALDTDPEFIEQLRLAIINDRQRKKDFEQLRQTLILNRKEEAEINAELTVLLDEIKASETNESIPEIRLTGPVDLTSTVALVADASIGT